VRVDIKSTLARLLEGDVIDAEDLPALPDDYAGD